MHARAVETHSASFLYSLFVWFIFKTFFNIIFLLIVWEFHIVHPYHIHFLILPSLPPTNPYDLPQEKEEQKEEKGKKSHIFVAHWSMVKLPVASPLKKTESSPTESHQL